jgi:dolichol-phosphate mannosyltransferase
VLFLHQLAELRLGRMWGFGLVGLSGLVLNLAAMTLLVAGGVNYVVAAILATELAIVSNFVLQERYVFHDLRHGLRLGGRAAHSILFNNAENLLRLPFLVLLVELLAMNEVLAQAVTLAVAFVGRFLFVTKVVYRPATPVPTPVPAPLEAAA